MASFGGYPQTVNYQNVTVSQGGGGAQNLLINPRGKINQANEGDGILTAGQYFCDGWKAGAAGAEVYIDADGFRLISGSIVQLVPNILEPTENLRGNMDVISGSPSISINSSGDNVTAGSGEYIQFEVSGDNSKFTRMILAVGNNLPVYQQQADELLPCKRFYKRIDLSDKPLYATRSEQGYNSHLNLIFDPMINTPALTLGSLRQGSALYILTNHRLTIEASSNYASIEGFCILDARP